MKLFRILTLLAFVGIVQAQQPVSDLPAFKSSLVQFQKQSENWKVAITRVNAEDLPIGYREGKQVDQYKSLALGNLDLAYKLSARILQTPSLSDEINFLTTVQELSHSTADLATLLLNANLRDRASVNKIGDWSDRLTDVSSKGINDLYVNTYKYVTARAREVEASAQKGRQ